MEIGWIHQCVFVCITVRQRVNVGSEAESGFGFSWWWCVLFVCNLCVRLCRVLDHPEIRDCAAHYSKHTAVSALGQIYWPSNHGSQ